MYAIIRTGGKQAKVRPGDVLEVELLKSEEEQVTFTPLLVVGDDGVAVSDRSELSGMPVTAKILGEVKGEKLDIFKYKSKTGYRRRMGHRQRYSQIEVLSIGGPAKKKAAASKPKAAAKPRPAAKAAPAAETSEEE